MGDIIIHENAHVTVQIEMSSFVRIIEIASPLGALLLPIQSQPKQPERAL